MRCRNTFWGSDCFNAGWDFFLAGEQDLKSRLKGLEHPCLEVGVGLRGSGLQGSRV